MPKSAAQPARRARQLTTAGLLCLALCGVHSRAQAAVTITRLSSPVFYIDSNANAPAKYVAYRVTNGDPGPIADAWVTLGGFSGLVFSLATLEDGWYHIGYLAPGQSSTAYFLLAATGVTATPQTHLVSVHSQPWIAEPPIAMANFGLTCEATLSAQATRLTSWVVGSSPAEVGSTLTLYVEGETGTVGGSGVFAHSPATLPTWPADKLELVASLLTTHAPLDCIGTVTGTHPDGLFIQPMPTSCFRIAYTFRCTQPTDVETAVDPNVAIASGQSMKHSGNVTSVPLPSTINRLRVEHDVSPPTLSSAGMVTCTVRIINEGASPASIDLVTEDLPDSPAPASFVPGSAQVNGLPIPDPAVQGGLLWFGIPGVVPAGGHLVLTFDAQVPGTTGPYTFAAKGRVGSFVLDATLAPTDDTPATATVTVGQLGVDDFPPAIAALHGASPDPVLGQSAVRFTLAEDVVVSLVVRDLMGRTVAMLAEREPRPAGRHSVALPAETLSPGVYVLCLSAGGRTLSRSMTVLR